VSKVPSEDLTGQTQQHVDYTLPSGHHEMLSYYESQLLSEVSLLLLATTDSSFAAVWPVHVAWLYNKWTCSLGCACH